MKSKQWDKLTDKYFKEILSPFAKGVQNPIYGVLESIKNKNKVIDLGCGLGMSIPFLSKNFKEVTAIDFSQKMIEKAMKNNNARNIKFLVKDMTDLKEFHNQFDVALSINSMLMPSLIQVNKAFQEAYNVLKKNGVFLGIFPAIESEFYEAMITFEREYKKTRNELQAIKNTIREVGQNYDFLFGFIDYNGKQKHYYGFEVDYRLRQAGFKDIQISKVSYPWKVYGGKPFRNKPGIWDWFVTAKK